MFKIKSPAKYFSLLAILITLITGVWNTSNTKRYNSTKFISHDVSGYYSYLPAFFIYKDLNFNYLEHLPDDYKPYHALELTEDSSRFQRYTFGVAIMMLPFFAMANVHCMIIGTPFTGYFYPFSLYISIAAIFWLFVGLYHLREFLLRYFSDRTTAITIICITVGTNLLNYFTHEPGMSHVYSFALICIFVCYTARYYDNRNNFTVLILSFTLGIITLIRLPNLMVASFFVLFGISSSSNLSARIKLLFTNWKDLAFCALIVSLFVLLQVSIWYHQTGKVFLNPFFVSYFNWTNPRIIDGLFSYRKGWLLYTPMMIFALVGLISLYRKHRGLFYPILTIFLPAVYLIFSWYMWWYGGSFGMRPMIDFYGLLAIPFACLMSWLFRKGWFVALPTVIVLLFTIYLNCFQFYQYSRIGNLHWELMNKETYWAIFHSLKYPQNYNEQLDKDPWEAERSKQ